LTALETDSVKRQYKNHYKLESIHHNHAEKGIPISNSRARVICEYCHQHLPFSINNCHTCGLPLQHHKSIAHTTNATCGNCLINSPNYNRVVSAFHYETPVSDFVTQLKYSAQFQLLPLLVDYLANKITQYYTRKELPELLVAIPLHPTKQKSRGFNQAQLIANRLSRQFSIPVAYSGVERVKMTKAQSGLDAKQRKQNIKDAFKISFSLPSHIAVIDDVITTGLTISEFTKTALGSGCRKVDAWSIARAYEL
jgi:ComF family protein